MSILPKRLKEEKMNKLDFMVNFLLCCKNNIINFLQCRKTDEKNIKMSFYRNLANVRKKKRKISKIQLKM